MTYEIDDDIQSPEAQVLPLKDTHRADRRARTRAASLRQLTIARELQQVEATEEPGRFKKHHSLGSHHSAPQHKHQPSIQELSFGQSRLHPVEAVTTEPPRAETPVASNEGAQAAA